MSTAIAPPPRCGILGGNVEEGEETAVHRVLWGLFVAALCPMCLAGARGAGGQPREGDLKVGDPAPDFELPLLGGEGKVRLSAFKGDRPVALIFGSYT